jgi:hypothetical protein
MAELFQWQIEETAKCSAECEVGIKGNLGSDVNLSLGDTTKTAGGGGLCCDQNPRLSENGRKKTTRIRIK